MNAQRPLVLSVVFILFLAFWLFFVGLGDRSFRNPDEGRYAEISREMVLSGDFATPTLYGIEYLRKPPFFYWLVALSFKLFGFTETAARSVPALFGVFGVLATFFFTLKVFDRRTAFLSSVILCSNIWYLQVGRYLLIDMVFSFFLVGALYLFYLGMTGSKHKAFYYLSFYFFLALAFLTKGLAALALAGIPIVLYLLFTRKFLNVLSEMKLAFGAVIFLAISLPWFVRMASARPDFLNFFFWHEHLQRFVSSHFEHQEPWFYYLAVLPLVFLPWTLFLKPWQNAFSFLKNIKREDGKFFLFVSALSTVLFYSMSRTKLPTYILPSLPLFSVLLASGWKDMQKAPKAFLIPSAALLFAGIAAATAAPSFLSRFKESFTADLAVQIRLMGCVLVAGSVLCFRAIRRERAGLLFYVLAAMGIGVSMIVSLAMDSMNPSYSTKSFAESLKGRLQNEDAVFIYDHPGPFYDLSFYLDHPVKVVGLEGEFELSRKEPQALAASVTKNKFMTMLKAREKFFCILRTSDFTALDPDIRENLAVIKQDDRKVFFQSGAHL